MIHVQVVPKGAIWCHHPNQLQLCYISDSDNNVKDVSSTSDASPESTTESFTLKEESLLSSSTSKDIDTEEFSLLSVTHVSDLTTSSSNPPYTRDDPNFYVP